MGNIRDSPTQYQDARLQSPAFFSIGKAARRTSGRFFCVPCETYTEAEYRTRDKVTIGAFFDTRKQEWTAYILTKNDTSQSMKLLDAESLELLKEEMVKARDLIARETR